MASCPKTSIKPGKTFAKEIEKLELKRCEAADLFGVDATTITYWARRGVGKKYVESVADILGVPAGDIIGRGRGRRSKVKRLIVQTKSPAEALATSTGNARLRPELIVDLARTPLSDEQADLLRIIINSYGEIA